ncbi:hypothetical protein [Spiroplasma endosymbiont of Labia minor]|uniref:hypothetical protein n=1 Tax=Spiroplasma endosymbiont of Labia minor TaxID=3066305 RepID=UPI0030D4B0A5
MNIEKLIRLSNGVVLAVGNSGVIYKLTDQGTIDTSVGNGTGIVENKTFDNPITSVIQLSNGIILAGTWNNGEDASIYKLIN